MRAGEFDKPVIDMLEVGLVEVSRILEGKPQVFESSKTWAQFNDVVSKIRSAKPTIGDYYAVLNIITVPAGEFLLQQGHKQPIKLIKINDQGSHLQYEFDSGKEIVKYPDEHRSGDRLSKTFLFTQPEDLDKSLTLIILSLPDWDIRNKLVENFADGKVKGKSRPGRFKRAGVSCKGSVTSLRKKAKNSSGEKQKGYHWCANMKSGRKRSKT